MIKNLFLSVLILIFFGFQIVYSQANAGPDQEICTDSTYMQALNPFPYSGEWTQVAGTGVIVDETLFNTQVKNLYRGILSKFVWTVFIQGELFSDTVVIINNAPFVFTIDDFIVCTDNATLFASPLQQNETGLWTVIEGDGIIVNPTNNITQVTDLSYQENIFRWTVTNGYCTAYSDITVFNHYPDSIYLPNAGPDQIICGSHTILEANELLPGWEGCWSVAGGMAVIVSPTNTTTEVYNLSPGINRLIWTILLPGYCSYYDDVMITNNEVTAEAGPDQTICVDNTELNAMYPPYQGTGYWINISGNSALIENSLQNNTEVNNLPYGTTSFQWTVEQGNCSASDIVDITNVGITATASNQEACGGDFILDGNDPSVFGGTGLWEVLSGTGIIYDPTLYNTEFTGVPTGAITTLIWTVTDQTCYDDTVITLTNNDFNISAGPDMPLCSDYIEFPVEEDAYWTYLTGCGSITENTTTNMWEVDLCQGENELELTITRNGCSNSDTIIITNNSPIQAIADDDAEICTTEYTLIGNEPGVGETGLWTNEFGAIGVIIDPTNNITMVHSIGEGANTFRWTVSNAFCSTYDDIVITNSSISVDVGLDRQICTDSTFLGAADAGVWELIDGCATFSDTVDNMIYLTNICLGDNIFTCTFTNGICEAVDTLIITNNSVYSYTGADIIVCTDYAYLYASPLQQNETGLWTVIEGDGIIVNPTNNYTQVTDLSYQENIFRWTVTNGYCTAYSDITVINHYPDSIFLPNAGADQVICDDYTILEANELLPGWEGYWSVAGGMAVIVSPTNTTTEVYNLSPGINLFKWTILLPGFCSYYDYVMITNNSFDAYAGEDQIICIDTAKMHAIYEPGATLQEWLVLAGGGVFDNVNDPETVVRNISQAVNIYRWHITKDGCSSYDEVMITNNSFEINAGFDETVNTETYQLNAEDPFPGTGIWSVLFGSGIFDNFAIFNTNVSGYIEGDNTYVWTVIRNGCTDDDEVTITYDPVSTDDLNNQNFNVYPNPTNSLITISSSIDLSGAIFEFTDISGQKVPYSFINETTNAFSIDLSNLAKGMYFLMIRIKGQTKMLRLVKK